jgi:cytochrome b
MGPEHSDGYTVQQSRDASAEVRYGLIWDLPLRLFHGVLLMATSAAFVTQWLGDEWFSWHRRAGYVVLVLILFRCVWGFCGPRYARFSSFIRGPRQVLATATRLSRASHQSSLGHNPLGAWMIVMLLLILGSQALLGLFADDEVSEVGPLVGYVTAHLSHVSAHYHRVLSNFILAAIALHLAAVMYYQWVLKDDLIRPMISGFKTQVPPGSAITSQRLWLASALLLVAAGAVLLLILSAPAVPDLW